MHCSCLLCTRTQTGNETDTHHRLHRLPSIQVKCRILNGNQRTLSGVEKEMKDVVSRYLIREICAPMESSVLDT